jgi:hypothetical protein
MEVGWCYGDLSHEGREDGSCSSHFINYNCLKNICRETWRQDSLEKPRRRWMLGL